MQKRTQLFNMNKKQGSPYTIKSPAGIVTRSKVINNKLKSPMGPKSVTLTLSNKTDNTNKKDICIQTEMVPSNNNASIQTDIHFTNIQNTQELLGENWLTDQTLYNYFDLLNDKIMNKKCCLIVNPTVSHAIKSIDDYSHFVDPLQIHGKELLIIPINDSEQLYPIGSQGSHWSILIYKNKDNKFYHYDSLKGHNLCSAKIVAKKLAMYMTGNTNVAPPITEVSGPQQINSFDCGTYSILAVEAIVSQVINVIDIQNVNMEEIVNLRPTWADLITKRATLAYLLNNKSRVNADILYDLMLKNPLFQRSSVIRERKPSNFNKCNDWVTVSSRNKKNTSLNLKKAYDSVQSLTNSDNSDLQMYYNRYSCLMSECPSPQINQETKEEFYIKELMPKKRQHKPRVLLATDSHGRRCSELLNDHLKNQFEVTSIIKPNAKFNQVTENLENLTTNFTEEDYVVIIGGTNDVPDANTRNFNSRTHFNFNVFNNLTKKTNVIFPGVLRRFDQPALNYKIKDLNNYFNKNISDLADKTQNFVQVNNFKLTRSDHTKHGLHLNFKGKTKLCEALSDTIQKDYFKKKHACLKLRNLGNATYSSVRDSVSSRCSMESELLGFSEESVLEARRVLELHEEINNDRTSVMDNDTNIFLEI